jgi:hypothetical protein
LIPTTNWHNACINPLEQEIECGGIVFRKLGKVLGGFLEFAVEHVIKVWYSFTKKNFVHSEKAFLGTDVDIHHLCAHHTIHSISFRLL